MRRLIVALLVLFPAGAAAQEQAIRDTSSRLLAGVVFVASASPDSVAPGEQQPPPPPPPRRRPSMVGYVGDASIGSQFRFRFDAGSEITSPDRAEFFYAKCGCYRGLPTDHPGYDPDAPGPGPGIAGDLNFQQAYLYGEVGVTGRISVYGELPIRRLQPQSFVPGFGTFENSSGISDIRAGVKLGLASAEDHQVTLQLQADLPSGDAAKGLGVDHVSFAPMLLYFQRVGSRGAIESQFGTVHPLDGSAGIPTNGPDKFAGTVIIYGAGASVELAPDSRVRFAPVVELFGWHVVDGFQTSTLGPADSTDILNLKIGARLGIGDRGSIYVGYGRALTDATWYHDIVRVEYRYGF